MTQFFTDDGRAHAATVISAGPLVVTQVKTVATDGYNAVQVGFGSKREKNLTKAEIGHYKGLGNFRSVREFLVSDSEIGNYKVGDTIKADSFVVGDTLRVSGTSKAKGFQGVVKRHGFAGGPRSHGQKHSEREAGSIGGSGGRAGGRVAKGMRMAGRTGGDRITVRNLKVLAIDASANLIVIKGALPGRRGTLVELVA